jgi:hypothetical protein
MRKNTPYQYKLDFGEGAECHEAYQEYLKQYELEDDNERWVMFTVAWNQFKGFVALEEREGYTIQ